MQNLEIYSVVYVTNTKNVQYWETQSVLYAIRFRARRSMIQVGTIPHAGQISPYREHPETGHSENTAMLNARGENTWRLYICDPMHL